MSTVYGIYGASGFGKEILSLVKEQFGSKSKIVFVDDGDVPNELLGCDILNFEQFVNLEGQKKVTIAIANSKIREKLTLKCLENGVETFDVKASNVVVLENVKMDDLKKALEDIRQRQNPVQERVNPLANEKNSEGR